MKNLFVTGTDTGVGKTWATLGLMARCQAAGQRVNGMKPVASGGVRQGAQRINEDADLIRRQCSRVVAYRQVNPYSFVRPIAPHLAAREEGVKVDMQVLYHAFCALAKGADRVIVEGVGGWRVPLAEDIQTEALARRFDLAVVLVVGLRLGCINHALLTAESILAAKLPFAGWLGNCIVPDYADRPATLEYLRTQLAAPFLGEIPRLRRLDPVAVGGALDVGSL